MKKVTVLFGMLTALALLLSVFFKAFHVPGANILLMLGVGAFLALFLLFLAIQKVKASSLRAEKALHIIRHLAYMDIALGIMFSLLHYPGALTMFLTGCAVYILICLPLIYKVHKEKHPEENALSKIMLSLIIITLIFAYGNRNDLQRLFKHIIIQNEQVLTMTAANDTTMAKVMKDFELNRTQFPGQVHPAYLKAIRIKKLSDSLVDFLTTCKSEVAVLCGNETIEGVKMADLKGLDNCSDPSLYFYGSSAEDQSGKAFEIRKRLQAMNDSLKEIMKPEDGKVLTLPIMIKNFTCPDNGEELSWEETLFNGTLLINDLSYLDLLILSIKQNEKEMISGLLSDARSDAMWVFWNKYKALRPNDKAE